MRLRIVHKTPWQASQVFDLDTGVEIGRDIPTSERHVLYARPGDTVAFDAFARSAAGELVAEMPGGSVARRRCSAVVAEVNGLPDRAILGNMGAGRSART